MLPFDPIRRREFLFLGVTDEDKVVPQKGVIEKRPDNADPSNVNSTVTAKCTLNRQLGIISDRFCAYQCLQETLEDLITLKCRPSCPFSRGEIST